MIHLVMLWSEIYSYVSDFTIYTYEKNMGKIVFIGGPVVWNPSQRVSNHWQIFGKRRHSIFRDDGTYQKYIIFQRKNGTCFPNPSNQGWMMEHTFKKNTSYYSILRDGTYQKYLVTSQSSCMENT